MQTMILQTISGNKPTSPKAKVLNYGKVWFDIEGGQTFLVSPKWKLNIASIMILYWNQASTYIPKMVSSMFAGVNTRLVP